MPKLLPGGLLLALLAPLPGCRTLGPVPQTVDEALTRVNDNLSQINAPLYCKDARVSFSFRDAKNRRRSFLGHPATVIFEQPRNLYFDIKAGLTNESVARVGSNSDQYWFWVTVGDQHKLWHGSWDALQSDASRRLPIPPDDLLDALMFRPLPQALSHAPDAELQVKGKDHRLIYARLTDTGSPAGEREIKLDPYLPQQPIEIVDRDQNGRIVMRARLSNYARVGEDAKTATGPWTARKYRVEWPVTGASMTLDIHNAKFRPDQPPFYEFPSDWQGESENLDEPPPEAGPPGVQ